MLGCGGMLLRGWGLGGGNFLAADPDAGPIRIRLNHGNSDLRNLVETRPP